METTLRENRAAQQAADLNRISAVILIAATGCYVLLYILLGMLALWFWKAVSLVFSCAFAAALVFALLSLRKKRTTRGIVLAAVSALLFLLSFVPLADDMIAESRKESLEIYCTYKRLEGEYRYVVDSVAYPQSYKLGQVGVGQEMDIIFKTKRLYDSFVRDTARCPGCIHFVFTGNLKPPNRCLLEVTDYRINTTMNVMLDAKEIYLTLKGHFLDNGYIITSEDECFMSAEHPGKGFLFDQMMEDGYLESTLSWSSNELHVQYDIPDGAFTSDIFVKSPDIGERLKLWESKLHDEVLLLGLKEIMDRLTGREDNPDER